MSKRETPNAQSLEARYRAKRYLDLSFEPDTVYAIERHRTRSGRTVVTLKILFDDHFKGEPHLGQFTLGRAFAEFAGYRWDSAHLGWVLEPGVALPEVKPDLARIFGREVSIRPL